MIYYKNLETNNIIEFQNIQQIGISFYNETLFKILDEKKNKLEIQEYLFNKKKQELIEFVENEKDNKKANYIVKQGLEIVKMEYSIDEVIKIMEQFIKENIFPTYIYYDKKFLNKITFNSQQEVEFTLNKFVIERRNNYHNNIPENMQKINNCETLKELEELQLNFIDLVVEL